MSVRAGIAVQTPTDQMWPTTAPPVAAVGLNDDWQTAGITWAGFEPTDGRPWLEAWVSHIDRQDDGCSQ